MLVAVVALTEAGCDAGDPDGNAVTPGPVAFDATDEIAQHSGIYADAGNRVVFGGNAVENTGDEDAVLSSARVTGDVQNFQALVVETRVIPLEGPDQDTLGSAAWPFEDYDERSQPLDGYVLSPGARAEILLVVDVLETGTWTWPVTGLTYRVGDREHDHNNVRIPGLPEEG